uniref:Secreted protein n=1 Tax=Pyxicephalus adspersus TaxID=30357 RepID=A0AAV2ZMH2_PYXAD|nr:TPA: hypothetical protein GDO54_004139 [Pyxicephalus adspersus]
MWILVKALLLDSFMTVCRNSAQSNSKEVEIQYNNSCCITLSGAITVISEPNHCLPQLYDTSTFRNFSLNNQTKHHTSISSQSDIYTSESQ